MTKYTRMIFLFLASLFVCCGIFLLTKKIKDHSPTIIEYPLLNNGYDLSDPYTALIYYYLPESDEMVTCDTEMEREGDFLDALFSQWRDLSQLPSSVSLISYEEVFGKEETLSSGGSAYLQYTPTPPDIFLEISGNINEYVPFEGCIMESLVQTIETAYGDVQTLTIVVDGRVVYEG